MPVRTHQFRAVAFVENLPLKEVQAALSEGELTAHELHLKLSGGGDMLLYPFGSVVFHDVDPVRRDRELARLHSVRPGLTLQVVREEFSVHEDPTAHIGVNAGALVVDEWTPARLKVVALTVAQSAAMEYYETQVEQLFARTSLLGDRLERSGKVGWNVRTLHRLVGEAISTRAEVIQVLHLLDKPDATWEDSAMDLIYDDLRNEFDLRERYQALELKLDGALKALELCLDVARDRRLVWLEVAIVFLFMLEIVMSFVRSMGGG